MTRLPDWRTPPRRLPRRRPRASPSPTAATTAPASRPARSRRSPAPIRSRALGIRYTTLAGGRRALAARGYRDPVAFVRDALRGDPARAARASAISPWSRPREGPALGRGRRRRSSSPRRPTAASPCCRSPPPSPPSGSDMPPVGAAIGAAVTGASAPRSRRALTGAAFSRLRGRRPSPRSPSASRFSRHQPDADAEARSSRRAGVQDQRRLRRGRAGDDHPRPLRHRRRSRLCRQRRRRQRATTSCVLELGDFPAGCAG